MSVTDDIKARLDIVDYIGRYVPDLKRAGRYHKACCPFHGEKTPSFVVNADTQSWRCFGACAEGGDVFNFAMKKNGWTFSEAVRELGKLAGVEVNPLTPAKRADQERQERLLGILKIAADFYHEHLLSNDPDAAVVRQYAQESRGFTLETLARWRIGYAPAGWQNIRNALVELGYTEEDLLACGLLSKNDKGNVYDRFRNRLMIPICDERGAVIGFGARALSPEDSPKYLNSPQGALFDKSKTLFGLDKAKQSIRESGTAVIVEGYMDAIQAHQAGFLNVVAQMGTAMTEAQLGLLVPRYAKRIVLALDADVAGQSAMRRSLEVARQSLQRDDMGRLSVDLRIMQMADAKDPDDVLRTTPELWQGYVEGALDVAEFVIQQETADLKPNASLQERQAIAERILPLLTASENNPYTEENAQKLARRLRIPEKDMLIWAQTIRQEQKAHAEKQAKQATEPKTTQRPPVATTPPDTLPPPPDDGGYDYTGENDYFHSEEPPPLNPEDAERLWGNVAHEGMGEPPPPAYEEPLLPIPAPRPRLQGQFTKHKTERYCLQALVRNQDLLYEVNGKLRGYLATSVGNIEQTTGELCADDFSNTDHRMIFECLQAAHKQDRYPPDEFLRRTLDSTLMPVLEDLLHDDLVQVYNTLGGRMSADMAHIAQHREPNLNSDLQKTLLEVLELRSAALRREINELVFLSNETNETQDTQAQRHIIQLFDIKRRILSCFDQALHRLKFA